MNHGCYPDLLKFAHVIPVHKIGSKVVWSSFRPISLLSNFNRIFEKILFSRVYKYFEKFNILNCHQYGFPKQHSTNMDIYNILESKIGDRDEGKITCAVYLDLSKAFDTDKNLLLKKSSTTAYAEHHWNFSKVIYLIVNINKIPTKIYYRVNIFNFSF